MYENNYRRGCLAVLHAGSASSQAPELKDAQLETTYTRVRISYLPEWILGQNQNPFVQQNIWAHQLQNHTVQLPITFLFIAINEADFTWHKIKKVLWTPYIFHWWRGLVQEETLPFHNLFLGGKANGKLSYLPRPLGQNHGKSEFGMLSESWFSCPGVHPLVTLGLL